MIYMEEAKRSSLPDNVFGLPEDRKFPLDTEQHVRSAIKLFGHCDESKKHKLAKNIKKAANKYGIEIPETTQVYKYLNESYGLKSNYSYIDESLETILTTNPFEKQLTLYHGSSFQYEEEIIKPDAYCAGTRLSQMRMASFWAPTFEYAKLFGLFRLINKTTPYDAIFGGDCYHIYVKPSEYNKIKNEIKNKYIWVYEKTLDKKYINAGHTYIIDEYTINVPVKPDKSYCLKYKDFIDLFEDTVIKLPDDSDETMRKYCLNSADKMAKGGIAPKNLMKLFIYHNGIDYLDDIRDYKKLSKNDLDNIIKFNKELNSWDYGVLINGKVVTKNPDFTKYKTIPIRDIEKYHVGVCWDFVNYEAYWFKKNTKCEYKTYYIQIDDNKNCPSHTFLVFKYNNKYYYFESSWFKYQGIKEFNSYKEALNYVVKNHNKEFNKGGFKCYATEYNTAGLDANLDAITYMNRVTKNIKEIKIESCFIESSNKSKLQNNFKKKTGKNFKIIDINTSQAIKYMMEKENKDKKFITDLIKPFKGCIAVDTETDIEAGYIFITKKDNTISPLWIFEDYRGYGLGEKLLVEGMNKYNADGLWVYTDNEVAIRLYEKHGFYKTEHIEKRKDGELVFMNLKSNIKESYITESNNISYSESFDDVLNIVNSLNNKELHYICNGTFKKSPYVFYRKVLLVNNDPASFIEVYELPQLKNNGFIVIATKSKYRKMGFSKDLVDNFLNNDIKHYRNINRLIWKFDTDNYKSKKFAKTLGFEDYMGHGLGELVMDINESYIMEHESIAKNVIDKDGTLGYDSKGNPINGKLGSISNGILDSNIKHRIEEYDENREKLILESKDVVAAYQLFLDCEIKKMLDRKYEKNGNFYHGLADNMGSAINDIVELSKHLTDKQNDEIRKDPDKLNTLINQSTASSPIKSKGLTQSDVAKIMKEYHYIEDIKDPQLIKNLLYARQKYCNGIISLLQQMIKINYGILGIDISTADAISKGLGDKSTRKQSMAQIREIINKNKSKFVKSNCIDIRSLGGGICYNGDVEYLGDFNKSRNLDNMLQELLNYDVIIMHHGSESDISEDIYYTLIEVNFKHLVKENEKELNKYYDSKYDIYDDDAPALNGGWVHVLAKFVSEKEYSYEKFCKDVRVKYNENDHKYESFYNYCKRKAMEFATKAHKMNNDEVTTQNKWVVMSPIYTDGGSFVDMNKLVKWCIEDTLKHRKENNIITNKPVKIKILSCNPGGHKLDPEITNRKDVMVRYSLYSNYIESANCDDIYDSINNTLTSLNEMCYEYEIPINEEYITEDNIVSKIWYGIFTIAKNLISLIIDLVKKFIEKIKSLVKSIKEKTHRDSVIHGYKIKSSYIVLEGASVKQVNMSSYDELEKNVLKSIDTITKEMNKKMKEQTEVTKKIKDMAEKKMKDKSLKESYVQEGLEVLAATAFFAAIFGPGIYKEEIKPALEYTYKVSDRKLSKVPDFGFKNSKIAICNYAYYTLGIKNGENNTLILKKSDSSKLNKHVYLYKFKKGTLKLVSEGSFKDMCDDNNINIKEMDISKLSSRKNIYDLANKLIKNELKPYKNITAKGKFSYDDKEEYDNFINGNNDYIQIYYCSLWDLDSHARTSDTEEQNKNIWIPINNAIKNVNKKLPNGYSLSIEGDWDDIVIELTHTEKVYKEDAVDFDLPDDETPSEIVNNQYDSIQALLDDKDPKHIYLSSDWHVFKNHYKKEANYVNTNDIISWCKKNIKYDDVFMYLGDISYRWANEEDKSKAQEIFKSLPGIKILVLGNHDIMAGKDFYEGCGFHYVFQELKWGNYTFTHKPIQMENTSEDALNIHGHIHKWEGYNTTDGSKNVNVYPWYYNNKPVTLDYIINHKDKLMKDNKRTNWVGMGESVVMEKEDFIHSAYVKESEWKSKHRAKFVAAYKNMESKLKTYGNSLKYDKLIIDCADRGNGEWTSEEYIKNMDKFKGGPNDRASGICTKSLPVCRINKNNTPVLKRKAIEDKVVNIMNECIPNEYRKSENGYKKMFFFIRNNGGGVYSLIANSIIMNESTIEDPIIKECSDMINDFINKTKKIDEWAMASFNPILPTTKPYILKAVNDSGDVINSKLYALSPDIISDKYLVVDENSKLSIVDSSYFNSYNLEVYQYTGNELNIGKLKEAYDNDTIVSPNYIYETLSGKELLSSDQIDFDESFTKVDLELLYEKRMTELATINEQYNSSKNMTCALPIINESSILNCNTYNFDILEDVDGVFARNRYTGKRTRSVDRDYQITEAMIKTII